MASSQRGDRNVLAGGQYLRKLGEIVFASGKVRWRSRRRGAKRERLAHIRIANA